MDRRLCNSRALRRFSDRRSFSRQSTSILRIGYGHPSSIHSFGLAAGFHGALVKQTTGPYPDAFRNGHPEASDPPLYRLN